jgi:hypothetical protein
VKTVILTYDFYLYTIISDKVVSPNIAFHAKNVKNNNPVAGNTIVFTDIVLNLGDSYNSDIGVFTVPLGGIYLFTVQFCKDKGQRIDYGLVVDGVNRDAAIYQDNYGGHVSCYRLTTIVSVKSGNKVWVKVIYRSGSGQILNHYDAHCWTSFSGVIIHTE